MTTEWNKKSKPTERGVYQVGEGRRAIPDEDAAPKYAYWSGVCWSFTAPTIQSAKQFCGSKSSVQDRARRELVAEPA